MKGSKLYHAHVRRREAAQQKIEATDSVNRYFDKWGRITSRFESWTTPEYYEKADAALQNTKLQRERNAELLRRREALRKLLADELDTLESELKERTQRKNRSAPSNEILRSISDTFRRTTEEKRRTDLEAKIYQQWRHDAREDAILHESKSDHEAMAKMNWLDRQIVMQMDRDAENRQSEERTLRLHEESRKHMECLAERRANRDAEIAEQKAIQEAQIDELKQRTAEMDALRTAEQRLRKRLQAVDAERSAMTKNRENRQIRMQQPFNARRIKLVLRQRSDAVCDAVREDCALLDRLLEGGRGESLRALRVTFERVLASEQQKKLNVEAMYESEVKHLLAVQEQLWCDEEAEWARRLQRVIDEVADELRYDLSENMQRQRDLVAIKESRLKTVQTSNERLKVLLADQRRIDELSLEEDLRALEIAQQKKCSSRDGLRSPSSSCRSGSSQSGSGSIVDSLRNGGGSSIGGSELSAPRFGRKKIAWT